MPSSGLSTRCLRFEASGLSTRCLRSMVCVSRLCFDGMPSARFAGVASAGPCASPSVMVCRDDMPVRLCAMPRAMPRCTCRFSMICMPRCAVSLFDDMPALRWYAVSLSMICPSTCASMVCRDVPMIPRCGATCRVAFRSDVHLPCPRCPLMRLDGMPRVDI